jgi:hypothetical protein
VLETSLADVGRVAFDTSIPRSTWLSGLSLAVPLQRPSKVIVIATGTMTLPAGTSFSFKLGLGAAVEDPGRFQEFRGQVDRFDTRIPLAVQRTFTLGPGQHTLHLLAFNEIGAPLIRDITLTAIVIEE